MHRWNPSILHSDGRYWNASNVATTMQSPTRLQPEPTAIPSSPSPTQLELQITALRTQLKEWEKSFSLTHGGRKAGREDIKAEGAEGIGKVYKEYNHLRDVLEGKASVADGSNIEKAHSHQSTKEQSRKRKRPTEERASHKVTTATPRKSHARLASKNPSHPSTLDQYDPPSSITPRPLRSWIGPTPQRDGKVLGLFDMLSGSSKATPSTRQKRKADVLAERTGNIAQTPSRRKGGKDGDVFQFLDGDAEEDDAGNHTGKRQRFQRTPTSEGKKFLLSQFFATPSTARFVEMGEDEGLGDSKMDKTPLRTRLLAGRAPVQMENIPEEAEGLGPDSTPVFLRRTSSLTQRLLAAESQEPFSSPEKPVRTGPSSRLSLFRNGRSLSEIVKNLRKVQDEEHDDDMEALRETEKGRDEENDVAQLVGDSQAVDEEQNQRQDPEQPQRKAWKKRGQKRTTKRTKMKPPIARKQTKHASPSPDEGVSDSGSEDELAAAETTPIFATADGNSDLDFDPETEQGKATGRPPSKKSKTQDQPTGRTVKANALSHMNFRSLKIKNKNSKAKSRGFGRFGHR